MGLILNIETSTKNCSVAISDNQEIISFKELMSDNYSHSENLTVFIQDIIVDANINFADLSAIAVSMGPGSYTGLRIGVATAKGLCYSLDIPLISISTLQAMAKKAAELYPEYELFCPMIDARRMEVYSALYDRENAQKEPISADIINESSYINYSKKKLLFFGDGSDKCKKILDSENSYFLEKFYPSAKQMIEFAHEKFINQDFEDIAYFEPYYLKDFVLGRK